MQLHEIKNVHEIAAGAVITTSRNFSTFTEFLEIRLCRHPMNVESFFEGEVVLEATLLQN